MSYSSECVKRWRKRHRGLSNTMDRLYKGMKRSKRFQEWWPEIVAYYGGRCICPTCQHPDAPVTPDHVVSVVEHPSMNCLANLQPLCRSCNSRKGRWSHDYRPDKGAWIAAHVPYASMEFHRWRISPLSRPTPPPRGKIPHPPYHTCQTLRAWKTQQKRIAAGKIPRRLSLPAKEPNAQAS